MEHVQQRYNVKREKRLKKYAWLVKLFKIISSQGYIMSMAVLLLGGWYTVTVLTLSVFPVK